MSICLYLCSSISLNVLLTAVGLILSHMGYHPEMARLSHLGDGGGGGIFAFEGGFLLISDEFDLFWAILLDKQNMQEL